MSEGSVRRGTSVGASSRSLSTNCFMKRVLRGADSLSSGVAVCVWCVVCGVCVCVWYSSPKWHYNNCG